MSEEYDELDFANAHELVKIRQRYFRRPKSTKDVLSRLMARKGYSQTETQNELELVWSDLIGQKWNSKSKATVIRNGVLEVVVVNSVVHQQLEFQKKKLLIQIQQRLSKNNIKDIRYRVGKFN
ncbi:MAG: DciA family protein [Planctomycetota bacterium]